MRTHITLNKEVTCRKASPFPTTSLAVSKPTRQTLPGQRNTKTARFNTNLSHLVVSTWVELLSGLLKLGLDSRADVQGLGCRCVHVVLGVSGRNGVFSGLLGAGLSRGSSLGLAGRLGRSLGR